MKRLSSILAVLIAVILLCGTLSAPAAAADTAGYAAEVVRLVNAERARAGLPALAADTALSAAAQQRAQEIAVSFQHTRPGGRAWHTVLGAHGVTYSHAGENIACGQKTPADVMAGWMNSPGHRANILGDFTRIGVGVYEKNGTLYWAQLFTSDASGGSGGNANGNSGGLFANSNGGSGNVFALLWSWIAGALSSLTGGNSLTGGWGRLLRFN